MSVQRTQLLGADFIPGKNVQRVEIQRIEFSPGQKSPRHLHPCPVVGTIMQGSVLFELEGQPAQVLNAGDAFFEPANVVVPHFDNASETEIMIFMAHYLLDHEGEEKLRILGS